MARRMKGEGSLYQTKEKTWVCQYYDTEGNRRTKRFQRKTDGRAFLDSLKQERCLPENLGRPADTERRPTGLTVGKWLDQWLDNYKAGTIRPSTMYGYRQYAKHYIKPILGNKVISHITSTDIQRMYTRLKREGRVHEHPEYGHQLSDSMLSRIHAMLHHAMKDAQSAHLIAKNPTEGTVVPKPNYRPKQILNEAQLDTFLEAIEQDEVWRDFFYTELTTGLRRGEICGLQWEDFDEADGTLKIVRSVSSRKAGALDIGETKTNKGRRTISLPDSTAQRLRERKKAAISQWIFPNPLHPEEPVNPSYAYHRLKTILKNTGLPSIRFHDLRHPYVKPTTKKYF